MKIISNIIFLLICVISFINTEIFLFPNFSTNHLNPEKNISKNQESENINTNNEIKLNYFRGTADNTGILLAWETSNEKGINSFIIERSENGLSFIEIAEISAKGSVEKNVYSYKDVKSNKNYNYYRLKQKSNNLTSQNIDLLFVQNEPSLASDSQKILNTEPCFGKCEVSIDALKNKNQLIILDFIGNTIPIEIPVINKGKLNISFSNSNYLRSGIIIARSYKKSQPNLVK